MGSILAADEDAASLDGYGSDHTNPTRMTSPFRGSQPNLSSSRLLINMSEFSELVDAPMECMPQHQAMVGLDNVIVRIESMVSTLSSSVRARCRY